MAKRLFVVNDEQENACVRIPGRGMMAPEDSLLGRAEWKALSSRHLALRQVAPGGPIGLSAPCRDRVGEGREGKSRG